MDLADFPAMGCAAAQDPRVYVSFPCCFFTNPVSLILFVNTYIPFPQVSTQLL
jgi:hypothetical protein